MYGKSSKNLVPRNGCTLKVAVPARISGCANQKEVSLEDQIDNAKDLVAELYDGPVEFITIATKGKGERLDRPELEEIKALLRSGEIDLLVMEDVGRLVRGAEAVPIWGLAVDHGTRCIAPHDSCDTADDNWEEALMQACAAHVGHNAHVSKRLKQKLMNRFKKRGGVMSLPIAGYFKPPGATTYADWEKDDSATETIQAGLALLKKTGNCCAVADYFNACGFLPGPYARKKVWDGKMVRRFYGNPLLAGKPGRGFRKSIKIHETGRRVSVKNTDSEPVLLDFPHLAHVDYDELQAVNKQVADANKNYSRRRPKGIDLLARKSKKRTRFPGQHAKCWYCGRQYVWGGNGITDALMCNGPRDWHCWNSIGVNGPLASTRLLASITIGFDSLEGFEDQFAAMVELSSLQEDSAERRSQLAKRQQELDRQHTNIAAAIADIGLDEAFQGKLTAIKLERIALSDELKQLDAFERRELQLPRSSHDLRVAFHEAVALNRDTWEFGDVLRQIVPEFRIFLVRLADGGPLLPRAQVRFDLSGHIHAAQVSPEFKRLTEKYTVVDLFERPQREVIRSSVVRLAATGMSAAQIAAQLSTPTTVGQVQKALRLQQAMLELGVDDPYVFVASPPGDLKKLKRHRNRRYRFTPLDGHEPPQLDEVA